MSTLLAASRLPLFDRLAGVEPDAIDGVLLDGERLARSLARDLERLFNTLSGLTLEQFMGQGLTVLDYGLPDFTTLSVQSREDLDRLQQIIERAVAVFEPRLTRFEVQIQALPGERHRAHVSLRGAVWLDQQLRRVDFDLAFTPGEGAAFLTAQAGRDG
jgi:type VI secretion system protein ImpF